MPVRKLHRYTERDLSAIMAARNGGTVSVSLTAGDAVRLSGSESGSGAAGGVGGGNGAAKRSVKSKYRNVKTVLDGITFDSKAEARRYAQLKIQEMAGEITELTLQPVYELAPAVVIEGRKRPAIRYKADFEYMRGSHIVIEDVKGVATPVYRIKRHLMMWVLGLEITEIK